MQRPLATIALTTFNQARFVSQAIQSALKQDYSPLEIVVSDDASSDETLAILRSTVSGYDGPHQIRIFANERNLGVGAHTDRVGGLARGEMVFLAAGDDIDRPDRVSRVMASYTAAAGRVTAVSAASTMIDSAGREVGMMMQPTTDFSLKGIVTSGAPLIGPAAYSARVFREFGPIGPAVVAGEDLVLALRAALLGDIVILPQPVSFYRQHDASLMGQSSARSRSMQDYRRGLVRLLNGFAAARQVQLRDFKDFQNRQDGCLDKDGELLRILEELVQRDSIVAGMANGQWSATSAYFGRLLQGRISVRDFAKTFAMTRMPAVWYLYLRLRQRDVDKPYRE